MDPIYKVNSSIKNYCNGEITTNKSLQAPAFGYAGGDCATSRLLYNSAISDTYGMSNLEPISYENVVLDMKSNKSAFNTFYNLRRRLYHGVVSPSSSGKCIWENRTCSLELICSMLYQRTDGSDKTGYQKCLSGV